MQRLRLALLVLLAGVVGAGCPCVRGAVNASPELRWWLFSHYGASQICPEMLRRGVPLKLPQLGEASVGRFFPSQCDVRVDEARRSIVMTALGTGYVTLPFTRRVGFYVGMGVEYQPDFRLEEDATYVWGKFARFTTSPGGAAAQPDLRIIGVENPVVNLATQTPFGNVAAVIGSGLVASEIGRGFTVVRREDGDDFALGHLEPPDRPKRPLPGSRGRFVLESNVTSLHPRSRDYLGPFTIDHDDATLFVRARVAGAPVTHAIAERSVGEAWRRGYETALPLTVPPGPVVAHGPLAGDASLGFRLGRGVYYVVLENGAQPPLLGTAIPGAESVAQVIYSVEVEGR